MTEKERIEKRIKELKLSEQQLEIQIVATRAVITEMEALLEPLPESEEIVE